MEIRIVRLVSGDFYEAKVQVPPGLRIFDRDLPGHVVGGNNPYGVSETTIVAGSQVVLEERLRTLIGRVKESWNLLQGMPWRSEETVLV